MSTKAQLTEENQALLSSLEIFQERLAELEQALVTPDWTKIGGNNEKEFTRAALRKINYQARIYWLKNPLIKRAVAIKTAYTFGRGVTIQADHPEVDAVIQEFMDNQKNRAEFFEHQSRMLRETELELFGNTFFVFFVNPSTGRVLLRSMPVDEIEDILYNPEDAKDPWYYKRVWTQTETDLVTGAVRTVAKSAYYPDWRNNPKNDHPKTIGGVEVRPEFVYHIAINCLGDMKFGVSDVYAALDWAQAYKRFLEDWVTIVRAYAKFAMMVTAKGGKTGVEAARSKIQQVLQSTPAVQAGAAFVGQEGAKIEPLKTAGATTGMDDARRLMLMVCSATGIYETYLTGDPSTGNLATAKTMERPMELMFTDRQHLWKDVIHDILQYVVDHAALAPNGLLTGTEMEDGFGERIITLPLDPETGESISRTISVKFPPILEHDVEVMVQAISQAATLGGSPMAGTLRPEDVTKMMLEALGQDNIGETLELMFPEDGSAPKPGAEEALLRAVERLTEVLGHAG